MHARYRALTNSQYTRILYKTNVNDECRTIITRWRLSSHSLHIETGRYKKPKTLRENRVCTVCGTLEDEHHAIFVCTAHYFIRAKYKELLKKYNNVNDFLNPNCMDDIRIVGTMLREIEKNMKDLKMIV